MPLQYADYTELKGTDILGPGKLPKTFFYLEKFEVGALFIISYMGSQTTNYYCTFALIIMQLPIEISSYLKLPKEILSFP